MTDNTKQSCCEYRKKIVLSARVLSEEECGLSNTILADLFDWNENEEGGKPVLAVKFCPWCGKQRTLDDEARVTPPDPDVAVLPVPIAMPPKRCGMGDCQAIAFPGLIICLGHLRQEDEADAFPKALHIHCADCGECVSYPHPVPFGFGTCDACHEKRTIE